MKYVNNINNYKIISYLLEFFSYVLDSYLLEFIKLCVICIAGNIALHILSGSAREHFDLETLWTVGSQYDDKTNTSKESSIMDQYNAFLADLQPADYVQ